MKRRLILTAAVLAGLFFTDTTATAQQSEKLLKYGDMDHWVVRKIHESAVIGGNTKTLYEVGPDRTLDGNKPYKNAGGSPWGTSNVMAKVMGVVKTNCSVTRDKRGSGYCAKLTTHIESVRVLGMMNIKVLAAGSLFLGDVAEPITGTKDGPKSINWGIPFTARPKALKYDYKVQVTGEKNRIKQTGFSSKSTVPGQDYCVTVLFLQKRTEDAKGNITARRVGTMVVKYGKSTGGWVNGATYEILYGDIRNHPKYDAALMGLRNTDYARNSHGKSVLVHETGWAAANETPTHLSLQFASSHGGAFIGTPGNTLWIDNVKLVY
ncbi:MAG: PCMD domain-containing protein [Bacteroidales bacterium]|nr:PCMD domain-containing protein [Bacteroidales bacterium]MCM1146619.1 PCMD domain-containing protein [Bacteroidales bacterium]MCM1206011.1 PCMD domain-containing protein [Bacillota bacterium]MCM1510107.1 PCMD domain-containing protein [Clostridium sp.]